MDIFVQVIEGYTYKAGMAKLPISISIESDVPVEVAEKIDINSVALVKPGDPDFFLGFSRSITSIHRNSMVIDQKHPYRKEVDVLEDEDACDPLAPGKYQVRVDVTVFRKNSSGFTAEVLSKAIPLEICN